jgi:hypothetical protein
MDKDNFTPIKMLGMATMNMVEAFDEDRSSLSSNYGGTVAGPQRLPPVWQPPWNYLVLND